jgi:hypothetical protein
MGGVWCLDTTFTVFVGQGHAVIFCLLDTAVCKFCYVRHELSSNSWHEFILFMVDWSKYLESLNALKNLVWKIHVYIYSIYMWFTHVLWQYISGSIEHFHSFIGIGFHCNVWSWMYKTDVKFLQVFQSVNRLWFLEIYTYFLTFCCNINFLR